MGYSLKKSLNYPQANWGGLFLRTTSKTKLILLMETVTVYKFRGDGAGKESITEMPKTTWENWTKRRPNGSYVFKDGENWRLLTNGASVEVEKPQEIILSEEDIKKVASSTVEEAKKMLFNQHIVKGEELLAAGDKEGAIVEYKKASEILPKENYPKSQIKKINLELKSK